MFERADVGCYVVAREYEVIVVGLGAMGSAAAFHLARRGCSVLGIDRFVPPHTSGSSHGQTRIIREAYFEHPAYVPLVQRAYELWDDLSSAAAMPLLKRTGGLMIGPESGVVVSGARRSAEMHQLPHELLSAADVTRRFPAFRLSADMVAVWEPRAGILFPEQCVSTHLALARRHGAELHCPEKVQDWAARDGKVRVRTAHDEHVTRRLVLSAGPWIGSLLPELRFPFVVERQVLFWFSPGNTEIFKPDRCPVHLWEYAPDRYFYGFPDLGSGVKMAGHHEGIATCPETVPREVAPEEVQAMRRLLAPYLPALKGPLREATVCLYTNTPNSHFLIDSHPAHPEVLIVSPCSGHGFKFSSVIGEIVADWAMGVEPRFDLSLFRYGSFLGPNQR